MIDRTLLLDHVNADALPSWPVTWGVALPPGELDSDRSPGLVLEAPNGAIFPASFRTLRRHPDGSVHRMTVDSEVALPGDCSLRYQLRERRESDPPPLKIDAPSELIGAAGSLTIDDGKLLWESALGAFDFTFRASGRRDVDGTQPVDLFAAFTSLRNHWSNVQNVCVLEGALYDNLDPLVDLTVTIQIPKHTPVLMFSVAVKCQDDPVQLDHFELRIEKRGALWSHVNYEVRQSPSINRSTLPLTVRSAKISLTMTQPDRTREQTSRLLNYNETWLSAENEAEKFIVGIPNFFECFPYGFSVEDQRITLEFWPRWNKPWQLAPGRGKTHTFALAALPADSPYEPRAIGYAFCKPPVPRMDFSQLAEAGVMDDLLAYQPDLYPRVETLLFDLAYNRNRGLGKMNFGDDYSELYTQQRRGQGAIVWNNLEGDHPYHMFCQTARTGRYFFFKDYRDSLQHWSDVDFCDHHPDRAMMGALTAHSANHVTGSASPCHNWAESFKEWYFHTGNDRPLKILEMMADWLVLKHETGFFKIDPEPYVRGCGWGLIQMAAIQEVLARPSLEAIIRPLCADLLDYCRRKNGLVMTMPTGGSWAPRDNAFHTATVVLGAYNCWKLYRDPIMRELALTATAPLMDRRTSTPEGIAVYISGPEQDFPMQQSATFAMAALAVAYRLTGDQQFVKRGMRNLEYCLDRGMIVDHMRIPGKFEEIGDDVLVRPALETPNSQLLSYQLRGLLLFMRAAHDTGMLKQVDYRF